MPAAGSITRLITALTVVVATAGAARAGQWHFENHIVCSDCHTQHNSAAGQPMRTDNVALPAAGLLIRATATELCVSCHDGSNPSAPDVLDPVGYVAESAAGAFSSTTHHLNTATAVVPPGGSVAMLLTCTTCHDPHGNANYRNLRSDPLNPSVTTPAVSAVQTVVANGSNPAQVYVPANILYKSGMSAWCLKCHSTTAGNPAGDHPVDRPMFGARYASFTAWTSVTLPRVPVVTPLDDTIPSNDDQVMCLSCHKAHGSSNRAATIHADGSTLDSTCLQCHSQAKSTKHGDPVAGPSRLTNQDRGSCVQCHDALHASHRGAAIAYPFALFAPDDNDLCFTCHAAPSLAAIYPGSAFWQQSVHARSINGGNKCIDCHEPHSVIGAMLRKRDSDLCLSCHDGSRGADLAREFAKQYRHPIGTGARHVPGESAPAAFAAAPVDNRHSECSDCHNAHSIDASPAPPSPPQASNRLAGVSRIEVANGGAGLAPSYIWRGAGDPGAKEYEICFKCHSSYTTQLPGQSNLALLTNPANASYHPIQAAGKNARIDPNSFANNRDAQSLIFCTDCHSSDTPNLRGPHGSAYRYLLKKPSATSVGAAFIPMQADDICFDCHAYDVYANGASTNTVQGYSRFARDRGHAFHVETQRLTCYTCHETHGSVLRPALIATRFGAISSYTQTSNGGSCTSSCHSTQTYSVSYPR